MGLRVLVCNDQLLPGFLVFEMLSTSSARGLGEGKWNEDGSSLDKGVPEVDRVEDVEGVWSCKLIFKSEAIERAYR